MLYAIAANETQAADAVTGDLISGNIIWLYALIIALLVLVPHLVDMFKAYKAQGEIRRQLIEKCAQDGIDPTELKELLKEAAKSPPGITGLTRGAIALTVIVILGIALFHLIITRQSTDDQTIGNILTMVGSLVAAIVGFYFGGRTKDKAAEEAAAEVTEKTKEVTKEAAKKAADEAKVEITEKTKEVTKETVEKTAEQLTSKIKEKFNIK